MPLKVLIVGLGGIGQRHARNFRTILGDQVEIIAYRQRGLEYLLAEDLSIVPSKNVEAELNLATYPSLESALAEQPDVVFVTNPTSQHIPIALAAAQAHCHLFIEKPLSNNLAGVEQLVNLVAQHGLVVTVGYQLRFHPCILMLKMLLEQEVVGPVLAAHLEIGEYLPGWHPYEDYRQMYASKHDLGGGVILSQIHELDLIYWLFGKPKLVFGLGGHWSSLDIDVEDVSSVLLECRHHGRSLPVHLHQDYCQRPPSRIFQIIGEYGKIFVDMNALEVRVVDGRTLKSDTKRFENYQRNQAFVDELEQYLRCLQGREVPVVGLQDGVQSLRIALSAKESIMSGRVVHLE